jgi:TRAP-type uncharacterized transport system substrate-binding protein
MKILTHRYYFVFLLIGIIFYTHPLLAQTRNTEALVRANQGTIGLVSGSYASTALNLASDMAEVLDDFETFKTRMVILLGKGSGQNIADLLYLRGTDIAIVQADILDHIKRNKTYHNIDGLLRYITKLHDKEIHLLTHRSIQTIAELNGKNINLGSQKSDSFVTGSILLALNNIEGHLELDKPETALKKLLNGKTDAMVLVDGKPSPLLANLPSDHNLHLLAIENDVLAEKYLSSEFSHSDYPELVPEGSNIPTLAVETVMAVYNWPADNSRYQQVSRFINKFFDKFTQLQSDRFHPKWQEIDIRANVSGWQRFAPATSWMNNNPPKPVPKARDELREQFDAFLESTQPDQEWTAEQKNKLFNQFQNWQSNSQQ